MPVHWRDGTQHSRAALPSPHSLAVLLHILVSGCIVDLQAGAAECSRTIMTAFHSHSHKCRGGGRTPPLAAAGAASSGVALRRPQHCTAAASQANAKVTFATCAHCTGESECPRSRDRTGGRRAQAARAAAVPSHAAAGLLTMQAQKHMGQGSAGTWWNGVSRLPQGGRAPDGSSSRQAGNGAGAGPNLRWYRRRIQGDGGCRASCRPRGWPASPRACMHTSQTQQQQHGM